MRLSLVISLLFHLSCLFAIQKTFRLNWINKPHPTYRIELARPPVDPLNKAAKPGTDLAGITPQKPLPSKQIEDTISLNTKDKRYTSYAKIIEKKLMNQWTYPLKALENLIEGEVLIIFALNRKGDLIETIITQPSSFAILDEEARRTIKAAAPFPSFPESINAARLNIRVNFAYRLTSQREEP